jgi:hypothetical protein
MLSGDMLTYGHSQTTDSDGACSGKRSALFFARQRRVLAAAFRLALGDITALTRGVPLKLASINASPTDVRAASGWRVSVAQ